MSGLSLRDVHVSLAGRPVLHGVTCDIGAGEMVGLVGPNGAGKSTALRAAAGLVAHSGHVGIAGRDTASMSAIERARALAYLSQEREIAWPLPVASLVALGRTPYGRAFGKPAQTDQDAVRQAMSLMDIDHLRERRATDLSGGEKARVLIARALAQDAPLLLADEPAAGLDPSHQIALMRLFAGLAEAGRSVVVSLHELGLAARWCTRIVLLDRGRIVADGTPRDVLTLQRLRAVYGVEAHIADADGRLVVQPVDLAEREQPS